MSRQSRMQRHHEGPPLIPRVPVIPMLDMAFQLLAFGLYCFDLSADKIEGQMTFALPKSGAEDPTPAPPVTIDEPVEDFTIRVESDGSGRVLSVELTTTKMPKPEPLPKDPKQLADDLKARVEKKALVNEPAPKLDMQFDGDLNFQLVFDLLGAADSAKFKKVTPNALTKPAKPMEPKP